MPPKRPIRNVFGDQDDDEDNLVLSSKPPIPSKKTKTASQPASLTSSIASSVPFSSSSASRTVPIANNVQAQVEAIRARVQAQLNAISAKSSTSSSTPPPSSIVAPTPKVSSQPTPATLGVSSPFTKPALNDIQRKVAEARARAEALQKRTGLQFSSSSQHVASHPVATNSTLSSTSETPKPPTAIHPLLLAGNAAKVSEQIRSMAPKFSTVQANARMPPALSSSRGGAWGGFQNRTVVPPEANPYLTNSLNAPSQDTDESKPKPRSMHKGFAFHKPGKHIKEAEETRREAQMEDLKRRIQESAKKAGMQDNLTGEEKVIKRLPPPEVEWWDMAFLPNKTYDDVPEHQDMLIKGKQKAQDQDAAEPVGPLLYGKDSPIDHYIQHPIPISAPSDKIQVQPKGVMLTKKEMRKMRRQRRQAELQDKRDRIKMGLLPPDPPKVKLSNLMRVLTSEAVADPTKVEARVRREIAARKEAHERMNAERKLTDDQRREKRLRQVEKEEHKGVFCQVYKIKHLVAPTHKFKVRKNAQDHHLTGVTIFNPSFALVIVEGSAKSLKAFKRLMTVRIDWTYPGRPKEQDDEEDPNSQDAASSSFLTPFADGVGGGGFRDLSTQNGEDVDLSQNLCQLIFEGPLREKNFSKGFRALACPTDHSAKEALGPKMEGYWDVAKRFSSAQDDVVV